MMVLAMEPVDKLQADDFLSFDGRVQFLIVGGGFMLAVVSNL
jgi:hypothetical protein